jgi:soluble P-type ATPase
MIQIDIPDWGVLELQHAVFDINGTLAVDGTPFPGVVERLRRLAELLSLQALTAGTHGNIAELERLLAIPIRIIEDGEEKARYVRQLGAEHVVAFGNGRNDISMLRTAALGIAVLSDEGIAVGALQAADIVALGPVDAIDLLLNPKRLIATLRG